MQNNSDEEQIQDPTDGTALGVMKAFSRSLKLEPRFLHYFGKANLEIVEHIIHSVKKNLPIRFTLNNIKHALFFMTPDKFQRWYINQFLRKGFDTLIMARKVMIKVRIKRAIENENVKQVLFLGAGYDPRALLESLQHTSVKFFEIDRGYTYEQKINALQTLPKQIYNIEVTQRQENAYVFNHNFISIKCDLIKDNLIDNLSKSGFDRTLKTLVIAEGLTLYLTKKDVDVLLGELHALITNDSEIIISFVGKFKTTAKREALLKKKEEQRLFSIKPHHIIYYVHAHGFEIKDKFTSKSSMSLEEQTWIKKYYENAIRRKTAYYTLVKAASPFRYKSINDVPEIQLDLVNIINQKSPTNE